MRYLLDTDICIYVMNRRPEGVIQRFKQFEPSEIGVSAVTVSELQYGVAKSRHPKKNQVRLEEFLAPFEILPYDETASGAYGNIRFQLEKRGLPIGPLDLLIAAQAVGSKLILVTNNEEEFGRIKELKIENWTKY